MLYILGGASRSGKTLLARRAVSEKQIPYFPLDSLFYALVHGAPELALKYRQSFTERPEKLWPVSSKILEFFSQEERDFLIEGDSLLPSQIHQLVSQGIQLKSCFLGYQGLTKEEKLVLVRTHHQGDIDWTRGIPDEKLLLDIEDMIKFSKYLNEECAKYGVAYFDVSHDFEGKRNSAYGYLFDE